MQTSLSYKADTLKYKEMCFKVSLLFIETLKQNFFADIEEFLITISRCTKEVFCYLFQMCV